jgi:hypothetical protein
VITKRLFADSEFPTGEATVQPLLRTRSGVVDVSRLTKHASEAFDYIRTVQPEPGKTAMLVLALGAEETYGANRNGDGFPEYPVYRRGGGKTAADAWVLPDEVLPRHHGSFERGHVFKHHVNRDPAKSSGTVKRAFWNPRMHRVELVISVDNAKDPEWVARVNDGEFPAVSMGCRIKYDVCAVCGNKAPTRAAYCSHARDHLGEILEDGQRCSVHNPSPDFFDISRVFRPADRTGYTLLKVARAWGPEHAVARNARSASLRKVSDIDKLIRGETVGAQLPSGVLSAVSQFRGAPMASPADCDDEVRMLGRAGGGLTSVLTAFRAAGVLLTTRDFLLAALSAGGGDHMFSEALVDALEAAQPEISRALSERPDLCDEIVDSDALQPHDRPDPAVRTAAARLRVKRGGLIPEEVWGGDEVPNTTLLSAESPRGTVQTTLGDAQRAGTVLDGSRIDALVGASGLLSSAYRAALSHPGAWGTPVRSDQGLLLPAGTEFGMRQGGWRVLVATAGRGRSVRTGSLNLDECSSFDDACRAVGSYVRRAVSG